MVAGTPKTRRSALPPPPNPREIAEASLFLDFDGTLVDLAPLPHEIRPHAQLPELLLQLAGALEGRLALVSGRALADLDAHLGEMPIAVAGSHGGELRTAHGETSRAVEGDAIPAEVGAAVQTFVADNRGLLVERKTLGIALHYRGDPALEAEVNGFAAALAQAHGLALKRGKMVVEIMPRGLDKGSAVRWLMAAAPFRGSTPVFVGDDITDEDGFRAAAALGGFGVLVGEPCETAARARLTGVQQVHDWLRGFIA